MRIIDADALIEKIKLREGGFVGYREIFNIEEMPTIDAVPVIRCKDCFWYDRGVCAPFSHEVEKNHFCSKGARRVVIHE